MLRIASYNIWHAGDFPYKLQTGKERKNPEQIARLLREEKVDICCLNEVCDFRPLGGKCQAETIARFAGLGFWHFAHAIDKDGYHYGNAIVSRYPLRLLSETPLILPEGRRTPSIFYEDRLLTAVEIDAPEGTLTFAFCHFGLSEADWDLALDAILPLAKAARGSFVLAGDFNLEPSVKQYGELASVLRDTAAGKNFLTFPSNEPTKKIDYIFVNDRVKVLDCDIPDVIYSDHKPIIANVETV